MMSAYSVFNKVKIKYMCGGWVRGLQGGTQAFLSLAFVIFASSFSPAFYSLG